MVEWLEQWRMASKKQKDEAIKGAEKYFVKRNKILKRVFFGLKRHSQQMQILIGIMKKIFIEELEEQ